MLEMIIKYDFYIILLAILIISLCNKIVYSKKCLKFLSITLPITFGWNIFVMTFCGNCPWEYPDDLGIVIWCYTQDIIFFPIVLLFGYVIINYCKQFKLQFIKCCDNIVSTIFIILAFYSIVDAFAFTIMLFFLVPSYIWYKNSLKSNNGLFIAILIGMPIMLVWDFFSTTIKINLFNAYSWKYNSLWIYKYWIFNSPLSITYLGIVGVLFIWFVYQHSSK